MCPEIGDGGDQLGSRRSLWCFSMPSPPLSSFFFCADLHGATGTRSRRSGSSSDGPTDAELRARVIAAAMERVPDLGWTMDALTQGAASCGRSVTR